MSDLNFSEDFAKGVEEFHLDEMRDLIESYFRAKHAVYSRNDEDEIVKVLKRASGQVHGKLLSALGECASMFRLNEEEEDEGESAKKRRKKRQEEIVDVDLFYAVESKGKRREWKANEQEQFKSRIGVWKERFSEDYRIEFNKADVEAYAKELTEKRVEFARDLAKEANVDEKFVFLSLPTFTAAFLLQVSKIVFLNWFPHDDLHTVRLSKWDEISENEKWHEQYPNAEFAYKTESQRSTTRAIFDDFALLSVAKGEILRFENVCFASIYEQWAKNELAKENMDDNDERKNKVEKPPFEEPDFFEKIAGFTFSLLLDPDRVKFLGRSIMLLANSTIWTFIDEVTEGNVSKKKYTLLRLNPDAHTEYSAITSILHKDTDFISVDPDKPMVVGVYMLCDNEEKSGKNDILVEAIPAPSSMVNKTDENFRGQSRRRTTGVLETGNFIRMRPSYTGWINPAAKGLVGNQSQITQEDLLANFDGVRDSEVPNGEGSNKMLGTDEAADTFQKTEIATGFGVPSVPSDQDQDRRESRNWSSVAKPSVAGNNGGPSPAKSTEDMDEDEVEDDFGD